MVRVNWMKIMVIVNEDFSVDSINALCNAC